MDAAKTEAGAAAGVMINASASAKAAADINAWCLRSLSKPSVTSEGGAFLAMVDMCEFNGGLRTCEFNGSDGGKLLTPAMVVANSTSTHAGIWPVNDRCSGLIVQVHTKLCGHLNQKRSIRVGTIV